jgi:hypothetical protein
MATRHRPRRGHPGNPLIEGDEGIFAGPQGGAKPGASESGDLASREFGVPQADIPGGVVHLVNEPAVPAATVKKPLRPADAHKRHGVPGGDGQYHDPEDESALGRAPKPEPVPKLSDAVPVYIRQAPGHRPKIRTLSGTNRRSLLAAFGDGAVRLCGRDPNRVEIWITNENSTRANNLLIGSRADIEAAIDFGATGVTSPGMSLPGNQGSQNYPIQDELFACNPSASTAITISWGTITEVEAEGAQE